jgi:cold-inducible RNA-binding protein
VKKFLHFVISFENSIMKLSIISALIFTASSVKAFSVTPSHSVTTSLFSTAEETSVTEEKTGRRTLGDNKQAEYGRSLPIPDTYVRCGRCATSYALALSDLGSGKGRRIECSLCSHSWFQTPERLFNVNENHELVALPESEVQRILSNIEAGRDPDYLGVLKFYVGNLDFSVTEDDLREVFSEAGEVGGVSIVADNETGRSRGFAFVTMMDDDVTDKVLKLDQKEVNGRAINVKPPNN